MKKINLLIIIFLLNQLNTEASHIVGGEFQLKLKRGFNYELSLRMYFDDISAAPGLLNYDLTIDAGIYEKNTNTFIGIAKLPRVSMDFIDYKYVQCSEYNSSKVRTRLMYYTMDIFLDPAIYTSPNGYYVTWERCCRNASVSNIRNSRNVGQSFYLEFPAVAINGQRFINSSPVFNKITGDFPCIQQTFNFPFGAIDPDGDSLTYRMVTPWDGNDNDPPRPAPFTPVMWETGFGTNNEIPGSPALTVDSKGNLSVKASKTGLFVFTVQCDEFRNGIKIGTVRRDFQFWVIDCPVSYSPHMEMKVPGETQFYNKKDTLSLTIGQSVCYNLFITDSTYNVYKRNKDLFLDLTNSNLPPNVFSLNFTTGTLSPGNDTLKPKLCINTCRLFADNNEDKLYYINAIVRDKNCPSPKMDSIHIPVLIKHFPNALPAIQISPCVCVADTSILVGNSLQFDVIGTDKDSTDHMTLIAWGDGFNLADAGMSFNNTDGFDSISSVFTWNSTCTAIKLGQTFKVFFQVDDNNCDAGSRKTTSVKLNLIDKQTTLSDLSPANLLTPNNDGMNDFFEMTNMPPDNCEYYFRNIEVYNTRGTRIFEDKSRNFKWNPINNSDGVYYYSIDLNKKLIKGWLQVMR
jgi:hypothetical protein